MNQSPFSGHLSTCKPWQNHHQLLPKFGNLSPCHYHHHAMYCLLPPNFTIVSGTNHFQHSLVSIIFSTLSSPYIIAYVVSPSSITIDYHHRKLDTSSQSPLQPACFHHRISILSLLPVFIINIYIRN